MVDVSGTFGIMSRSFCFLTELASFQHLKIITFDAFKIEMEVHANSKHMVEVGGLCHRISCNIILDLVVAFTIPIKYSVCVIGTGFPPEKKCTAFSAYTHRTIYAFCTFIESATQTQALNAYGAQCTEYGV